MIIQISCATVIGSYLQNGETKIEITILKTNWSFGFVKTLKLEKEGEK